MDNARRSPIGASSERWAEGPTIAASMWRYRWLVLTATLVLSAAGFTISQAQPEVYEASTQLHLTTPDTSGVFDQAGRTDLERYLPQQAQRVSSPPVLTTAAEMLDDGTSPADLAEQVEATADIELGTLSISATAGSPEQAAARANTMSVAYQEEVRSTQLDRVGRAVAELDQAAEDIEGQIAEVSGQADAGGLSAQAAADQVDVLTQRLLELETLSQQLRVDARLFDSGVEYLEEATPPETPVAPRPLMAAAGFGILGLLIASAAAYWLAGRARRVMSREQPGEVLGVPLLGVLPTYDVASRGTLRERTSLDPRAAEAYRFVYSSLEATLRQIGARSVMVTSAKPNAGKTETALQLAVTALRRERDVLLIDADLRMQGLTGFLRAKRAPGLIDLAEQSSPELAAKLVARYPVADNNRLPILTTGEIAGDGSDQLNERWLGRVVDHYVNNHELTMIDSPPLLAVADTATLAGYTDAIVLVVREGSDLDELEQVHQRLQFVEQRIVGYVYLSPSALDDTAFDYGLVRSSAWKNRAAKPAVTERDTQTPNGATHGGGPRHLESDRRSSPSAERSPERSPELFPGGPPPGSGGNGSYRGPA